MGTATGDVAGAKGSATNGGIYSAQTFDQWFSDVLGTNQSTQHTITLTKDSNGVWEYLTNAFHPIDNMLLGNEGKNHNHYFTYALSTQFTHHAGEHRFFEFKGDDDMWVFVNGKLAMDIGGITPATRQYLDVDRLSLTDGQKHTISFFYAQRQETAANFNLRTNLDLGAGTTQTFTVSQIAD
jgi:fibro-slime domain-containing protein